MRKFAGWVLLAVAATSGLASASTSLSQKAVEPHIPSSIGQHVEARVDSLSRTLLAFEAVSAANSAACVRTGKRLPFVIATNPQEIEGALKSAFSKQGMGTLPTLFAARLDMVGHHKKVIASIGGIAIAQGDADKAVKIASKLMGESKPIALKFTDGTQVLATASSGCAGSMVLAPTHSGEVPFNEGASFESLPASWGDLITNEDERLFLSGRSLYFVAGPGADVLRASTYAGTAVGALMALTTQGLTRSLPSASSVFAGIQRNSLLSEADVFGFHAAVNAGAHPLKIMQFVKRHSKQAPGGVKELFFTEDRINALLDSINAQERSRTTQAQWPRPVNTASSLLRQ